METLPDYLAVDLRLLVIGLNPSPASVAAGYYYGHPRNRFWPAMREASLVPADFLPSPENLAWLCNERGIGFTDIVKRPTPGGADLRAADYRHWAPVLSAHLRACRPRVAWFNGKGVYRNYLRYGLGRTGERVELGCQAEPPAPNVVAFVTPNPSPANAAFDLATLVAWYRAAGEASAEAAMSTQPEAE